jgi:putative membrane protein
MKDYVRVLGLATIMFSSAALAQSAGEKTGVNSTLGISPTTADFVKEAATSDMLEIESSKVAQQKGNGDEKSLPSK